MEKNKHSRKTWMMQVPGAVMKPFLTRPARLRSIPSFYPTDSPSWRSSALIHAEHLTLTDL